MIRADLHEERPCMCRQTWNMRFKAQPNNLGESYFQGCEKRKFTGNKWYSKLMKRCKRICLVLKYVKRWIKVEQKPNHQC